MAQLLQLPKLRMTTEVIAKQIDWVQQAPENEALERFDPALQIWLQARQSRVADLLKTHFRPRFERDGEDLTHWWSQLWQTSQRQAPSEPLKMVSALQWQDQGTW